MTIAVDQKAIIDKLLLGEARQVNVPYLLDVPGAPWYDPAWKPHDYNPTLAKQLLAEAGYPNGFSMKAFVYPLPYNPANGDVMEAVAGYWEAIGIKVERVVAEYRPTVRQTLTDRTTAGYAYSYTQPSYSDPYYYLSGSCCFRTDAVLNHWEITQIDQLTDQARLAYDDAKRNAIMKQVGDFIYNNYIGLPVAATTNLWAVRTDKIGNWPQAPGASTLKNLEYITHP
jgi:ABC-type transport system substrate-binding protein